MLTPKCGLKNQIKMANNSFNPKFVIKIASGGHQVYSGQICLMLRQHGELARVAGGRGPPGQPGTNDATAVVTRPQDEDRAPHFLWFQPIFIPSYSNDSRHHRRTRPAVYPLNTRHRSRCCVNFGQLSQHKHDLMFPWCILSWVLLENPRLTLFTHFPPQLYSKFKTLNVWMRPKENMVLSHLLEGNLTAIFD